MTEMAIETSVLLEDRVGFLQWKSPKKPTGGRIGTVPKKQESIIVGFKSKDS